MKCDSQRRQTAVQLSRVSLCLSRVHFSWRTPDRGVGPKLLGSRPKLSRGTEFSCMFVLYLLYLGFFLLSLSAGQPHPTGIVLFSLYFFYNIFDFH